MSRCPISYLKLETGEDYHLSGLKKIAPGLERLYPLPYTAEEQRIEAANRAKKMSIQGVQPKISAVFNKKKSCFELVDIHGRYIIKPQHHIYQAVPENEDLTMKLAGEIDISVPLHGMVYGKDRLLAYFIRRFDRPGLRKNKLHLEDFAQLAGKTRTTKYNYSLEKVVNLIETYCTFPQLEKTGFFKRVLFSFLTGNEDMHLKNYSVIYRGHKVELSPAYDLLNTTIILKKPVEESALPLDGKKSKFTRRLLVDYFGKERLGLSSRIISRIVERIRSSHGRWEELISISFLPEDQKEAYWDLVSERWKRVFG
jgi:serine/threonine-protein kinase HipA